MDVVEIALKELEKSLQKAHIKSNGFFVVDTKSRYKAKVKDNCKNRFSPMISSLTVSTSALKGAVKGHFGQKLTKVLKKQKDMLAHF